eukprot:scaffold81090_cov56-Phaeocystis_antarctica.AAC.1
MRVRLPAHVTAHDVSPHVPRIMLNTLNKSTLNTAASRPRKLKPLWMVLAGRPRKMPASCATAEPEK